MGLKIPLALNQGASSFPLILFTLPQGLTGFSPGISIYVLTWRPMPKRSLRKQLLHQRRALTHDAWLHASKLAQERLIQLPEFIEARCIALYAPFQNEIDTAALLQRAFSNGSRVLFPAVCGSSMLLRQVTTVGDLEQGAYGILEPCANGVDHQADEPDLIVVPGVAFDVRGHRIGYGKGYYDRFLNHADLNAHLIGLCHDFQIVENGLPAEEHDVCLHTIVSDRRLIRCKK